MLQAVIFDMDGLLIDSEPFWRQSHREVLSSYGHTLTDDDVRAMAGKRTDEVVRAWHARFGIKSITEVATATLITDKVRRHISLNGRALPGVYRAIELFKQHSVPMAVASSSSPEIIESVLGKLGIEAVFELAYSAIHEEFGKPHPAVFLTTARRLGAPPKNCLVFEDSISGVQAAKAAGMKCVAVPEPANRGRQEYAIADLTLDSLEAVSWPAVTALWQKRA